MEQKEPGNKATHICQLIYDKGGKHTQWERIVSSLNGVVKTGQPKKKSRKKKAEMLVNTVVFPLFRL